MRFFRGVSIRNYFESRYAENVLKAQLPEAGASCPVLPGCAGEEVPLAADVHLLREEKQPGDIRPLPKPFRSDSK